MSIPEGASGGDVPKKWENIVRVSLCLVEIILDICYLMWMEGIVSGFNADHSELIFFLL